MNLVHSQKTSQTRRLCQEADNLTLMFGTCCLKNNSYRSLIIKTIKLFNLMFQRRLCKFAKQINPPIKKLCSYTKHNVWKKANVCSSLISLKVTEALLNPVRWQMKEKHEWRSLKNITSGKSTFIVLKLSDTHWLILVIKDRTKPSIKQTGG